MHGQETMTEQQSTLVLPTKAIAEMRQIANDRSKANNIPSPRGAAEFDFQSKSSPEIGSSNDDDVKVCVPHSYHVLFLTALMCFCPALINIFVRYKSHKSTDGRC